MADTVITLHQTALMDAGVAALVGAGIGAIGSGAAAFISGWFAGRQSQIQAASQAETTRLQVRADHLLQNREPRAHAYSAFLDQGLLLIEVLSAASFDHEREEPDWKYDENGEPRVPAGTATDDSPSHTVFDIQRLFVFDSDGFVLAHGDELKTLDRLRSRVIVEGPTPVARSAQEFRDYLVERLVSFGQVMRPSPPSERDRREAQEEARRLLDKFAETAREALSDVGLTEFSSQDIS
ncbi:hypothetical protein ACWDQ0_34725 [Streptomyces sp. NPDC003642]